MELRIGHWVTTLVENIVNAIGWFLESLLPGELAIALLIISPLVMVLAVIARKWRNNPH